MGQAADPSAAALDEEEDDEADEDELDEPAFAALPDEAESLPDELDEPESLEPESPDPEPDPESALPAGIDADEPLRESVR